MISSKEEFERLLVEFQEHSSHTPKGRPLKLDQYRYEIFREIERRGGFSRVYREKKLLDVWRVAVPERPTTSSGNRLHRFYRKRLLPLDNWLRQRDGQEAPDGGPPDDDDDKVAEREYLEGCRAKGKSLVVDDGVCGEDAATRASPGQRENNDETRKRKRGCTTTKARGVDDDKNGCLLQPTMNGAVSIPTRRFTRILDSEDEPSPFDCEGRAMRVFDARRYWRDAVSRRGLVDVAVERAFATTRSERARAVGFTGRFVGRPVFAKLFWRNRTGKRAFERQNVEKSLLQRDLEAIVSRGTTPCLPFRMMSVSTTVGRFRKTRANRIIDARLRGMRIVDASEKSASFRKACTSFLSKDARADIEDESHRALLAAARDGRLVHETLDVKKPTLCRAGLVDVVFTEKCADRTLFDFLGDTSVDASACLPEVYLMLVHALSVFARRGISHNDLHSRNVVLRRVPPTVVSFGSARRFVTTVAPFVVDWDLGRSETVNNPELEDYGFVGLSDRANPLFDLYGLVKTFLYHRDAFARRSSSLGAVVATSENGARLADAFRELLEPATRRHGWLLEYEYRYFDDRSMRHKTQRCVQQTPYIPDRGSGKVEDRWPASVRELTPRFSEIGDRLHALVERPLGPDDLVPDDAKREFTFGDFLD